MALFPRRLTASANPKQRKRRKHFARIIAFWRKEASLPCLLFFARLSDRNGFVPYCYCRLSMYHVHETFNAMKTV